MNPLVQQGRHVLSILSSLGGGGAERVMLALAAGWLRRRHRVTLMTLDDTSSDAYPVPTGMMRVALGLAGPSRGLLPGAGANVRRILAMRRAIRSARPDVVVSFNNRTNIRTLLACRGLNVPVIVSERIDPSAESIGGIWSWLRRHTYRRCAALVMQSEAVRPWGERLAGVQRTVVIPNPVLPTGAAEELGPERDRVVLAAGRLVSQKGFDLLIDAFAAIAGEFPEWRLVILGEGSERDRLERQARALRLSARVSLPGWTDEPSAHYRTAGLFVLSSRFEGFPNVLVEAMAEGCPVLAADCPSGPAEIVRHGFDGLLVGAGSVPALAGGLRRLLADAVLRERLGQQAIGVRERYGLDSVLDCWESLITSTVTTRGGRCN